MRFFRFVAALVLIAALPVYGWASLGQSGVCAMEQPTLNAMADRVAECCNEAADGQADTVPPEAAQVDLCQAGQSCQTGSVSCLLPVILAPPLADAGHVVSGLWSAPHLSHSPPALWRPPRAS